MGRGDRACPGLRMPLGSSAVFTGGKDVETARRAPPRMNRARLMPIPWWWLSGSAVGEDAPGAGVPDLTVEGVLGGGVVRLGLAAEGEVEAGAVDVGVRLVGGHGEHAGHGADRVEGRPGRSGGSSPHGPVISMVSTDRADADERLEGVDVVAVRHPRSDERRVEGERSTWDSSSTTSMTASTMWGRPRRARAAGRCRRCRSSARPRWRRRGGARRGDAPRRRIRRHTSRPSSNGGEPDRVLSVVDRVPVGQPRRRAPTMTPSVPSDPRTAG